MQNEPVRIRNAADLFAVLTTGDPMAQMAVLQSIIGNPEKPLCLGPHEGEDFLDLLLRLIPQSSGSLKQALTVCLMCYQDERSTRFLVEEFARCTDPALVLRLASRIGLERDIEFFRPFIWGEKAAQALASARLCSQLEKLDPAERLRVAILLDSAFETPELNRQNLDLWLSELGGRHRVRARQLAESQPEGALLFWERWPDLASREQEWLLRLTARCQPELLKVKLPELLKGRQVTCLVVTLAVEHGINLPACLLAHEEPTVRAAAIFQGHADEQLDRYLGMEASAAEALAALHRCDPRRLVECLGDERWQVRGEVARLLCQLENPPLEDIRLKSESQELGTQVAAFTVLERLQTGA
jgi:hypothetical protein